jgi:tripeptidyl-peptidase I
MLDLQRKLILHLTMKHIDNSRNIPQGTKPIVNLIDGATAPATLANAGPESLLDFSLAIPLVYPQQVQLFQTDDDPTESSYTYGGFFNNFLDAIDGSYCNFTAYGETGNSVLDPPYPNPASGGYKGQLQCGVFQAPNVISISYGGDEQGFPMSYGERQCLEYLKLGMQGVTVVFSSGDSGVGSNDGCIVAGTDTTGFNATTSADGTIFNPDFGATCPWVTSVGSTFLPKGASVTADAEISTTRFPSGGGFSNFFPIPDYQSDAVKEYLENHQDPHQASSFPYYEAVNGSGVGQGGGIYNRAGRGHPDVAALGDNVVIYVQGSAQLIGGTSASAPIFASIITLINEQRLNAGKSPVGFVNPILYAHPEVFHDITNGSNPACGTTGFLAAEGWDPVSGLGTPNFPSLLNLLLNQQ